jgi:hypothetical protein
LSTEEELFRILRLRIAVEIDGHTKSLREIWILWS